MRTIGQPTWADIATPLQFETSPPFDRPDIASAVIGLLMQQPAPRGFVEVMIPGKLPVPDLMVRAHWHEEPRPMGHPRAFVMCFGTPHRE